ncbi:MAG: dihydroorotase [Saprospiraceae bacterium]|nr:dihydroorotase [Saprospiraceae bacterium]
MKLIIRNATIIDSTSPYNGERKDIYISKGKIEKIDVSIPNTEDIKEISGDNLHVSPGWMDIGCQIGEPGLEHRETLTSAIRAARRGGYTAIAPFPNTVPVLQQKAALNVLKEVAEREKFHIYPIAAATQDCNGDNITEMFDLHAGGAIAFSDGLKTIEKNGVLLNALNYIKSFDGLLIHFPQDGHLASGGQMHEGKVSTYLGMKGIPSVAESVVLRRDIGLWQYSDSRMCIYGVSTAESAKILKEAKSDKLSAIVPYLNLVMEDNDLDDFDSNLKVMPPIRSKKDGAELLKALKENTISAISSNHYPLDEEAKKLEFTYAKFGASGLETCFAALNGSLNEKIGLQVIVDKLAHGPRKVLKVEEVSVVEGKVAELTIFDPNMSWSFDKTLSKSDNNPFLGSQLKGRVIGTYVKSQYFKA